MPSVLFVCTGNTCRSPIAEACYKSVVDRKGELEQWEIESAGTHVDRLDQPPDPRGHKVMEPVGLWKYVQGRSAKLVTGEDFAKFDLLLAMDDNNFRNLMKMDVKEELKSKVKMFGEFDGTKPVAIADPYRSEDPQAYADVLHRIQKLSESLYAQQTGK